MTELLQLELKRLSNDIDRLADSTAELIGITNNTQEEAGDEPKRQRRAAKR